MTRPLVVTLAIVLAAFVLGLLRAGPPAPRGPDAPPEIFSAARAREVQRALVEVSPRPTGSEGNAKARAILVRYLEALGWKVELEEGFACGHHGSCAFVTNVIGTRVGVDPAAPPVMMSAHYDAVPCSPGANDDGDGSAALIESARAIAAAPPLRRTVVALFTDGEEDGLLGAELFARDHRLARALGAVVAIDSRGGRGPSMMYETSPGNAWLVALAARSFERPVTSSLFYEAYRRLPIDSDFTVLKRLAPGVNLANVGGVEGYHAPLDELVHSDPGTLQHQGEQVLAMTRALASADLEAVKSAPSGDAVWFDVLALGLVRWPTAWSVPLALVALALLVGHTLRRRVFTGARSVVVCAILTTPTTLAASLLASAGAALVLRRTGALAAPSIAHPEAALVAVHFAALAGGLAAARALARRTTPQALFSATWFSWAAAGLGVASAMPGASYPLVVPALVAGVAAVMRVERASHAAVAVAALVLAPMTVPLHDALGFFVPEVLALPTILLLTATAPVLGGAPPRAPWLLAAIASCALVVAMFVPPFSTALPQRVDVAFVQEGGRSRSSVNASWTTIAWGSPPRSMVDALGAGTRHETVLPWLLGGPVVDGPSIDEPPPTITVAASTGERVRRRVRVHLASPRGARSLLIELPPRRLVDVRVLGQPTTRAWGVLALRGVPREGVDVDLAIDGAEPVELVVRDLTYGVPSGTPAAAAVAARTSSAAETQDGDVTVLVAREAL